MSPISPTIEFTNHFKQPSLEATSLQGIEISQGADQIEFRSKWLRIAFSKKNPVITGFCWDSLGEGKVTQNLLRNTASGGLTLSQRPLFPEAASSVPMKFASDKNVVNYSETLPGGLSAKWEIRVEAKSIRMAVSSIAARDCLCRELIGLQFAFDPSITPVAPLANPRPGATAPLPLLLHAADYGTLVVRPIPENDPMVLTAQPGIRSAVKWDAVIRKAETPRS